jgi:hypothetical protein
LEPTQAPIQCVPGAICKVARVEVDHPPPNSAEASTAPYVLMVSCLVQCKDFTVLSNWGIYSFVSACLLISRKVLRINPIISSYTMPSRNHADVLLLKSDNFIL